jgi:glutathione S-transferase
MTITLYGCYRSRASRNIWLMNELGQPFAMIPVMQPDRTVPPGGWTTRSPEFAAVYPGSVIPVMKDGDLVLGESLAINLYLARKFGGPLSAASLAEDGQIAQWTLWAATVAEPLTIKVLYHSTKNPHGPTDPAIAREAAAALAKPFAVLDQHLAARGGFVVGGRFTVADINVAEVLRYARPAADLFANAPHVDAWLKACHERPAFKAMMAARDAEPV